MADIIIEYSEANGGPHKFRKPETAFKFLQNEEAFWRQIFPNAINNILSGVIFHIAAPEPKQIESAINSIKRLSLPYSKSPIGKLIEKIKSEQAPNEDGALAVFSFFSKWQRPTNQVVNQNWTAGYIQAIMYTNNLSPHKSDTINLSIEDQLKETREKVEAFETDSSASLDRIALLEKNLKNTDRAFTEQMQLMAASKYWKIRSSSHEQQEIKWGIIIVLYIIISVSIGFCLVHGFWEQASKLPEYGHIRAISMSVILFTFIIWGARIMTRTYLSNQHLKTDALERRTMIMTYLALTHKGKISEEERMLVLEPIFRPTADGLVKDDASPNLLANFISKNNNS